MNTFSGSYDQRSAINSQRKNKSRRESPKGDNQTPRDHSTNKMRFEGDQNESLVGDFESIKEENQYPIVSRLKSNASHETLGMDKMNSRLTHSPDGSPQPIEIEKQRNQLQIRLEQQQASNSEQSNHHLMSYPSLIQRYMEYLTN